MPEGGSGLDDGVEERRAFVELESGFRRVDSAWTLKILSHLLLDMEAKNTPMKCPSEDEVVINAQFVQTFCKVTLENEPTGLIDYNQRKDDPTCIRIGIK